MLTKERCYEIAEQVKRISSADEIEVYISGGRSALTRFANNTIHQNVADENHAVSVRTVFSGRTERATSEKLVTAGIFAVSEYMEALFNSRGMARHHQQTSSEISITMLADDSSGWQKSNSPDVRNLNAAALAETAARKARQSVAPRELVPG